MKRLNSPDTHHLSAAVGWLELGNWQEANEEIEKITAALRAHPDVLEVRLQIYLSAKKWAECIDLANALVKMVPRRSTGWIHRSFAFHELKRTQEAFDLLLPAAQQFKSEWPIPYNLACYCAQLGNLDDCRQWFIKAMAIDENAVKKSAVDDSDLKPLWDNMSGTVWKRTD